MSEEKNSQRYNISDNINERFYQLPKGLFLYPQYRSLDPLAKLMYSVLRDRLSLSKLNRWIDENGDIYLIFGQDKLAELMNFSQSAISKNMKKLEEIGLIERVKIGLRTVDRIYVNKLIVPDQSEILDDISEANLIPSDNPQIIKQAFQKVTNKEQKVKTFPEEYQEVHDATSRYSHRNNDETRENTKIFPEEYQEVHNATSRYSDRNNKIFPEEYQDIPTGISRYSQRNTNETDIKDTEYNDTINNNTHSGSAAEEPKSGLGKIENAVSEGLYAGSLPENIKNDIADAIKTYGEDMVMKAVEKTKKFRKHHFAYTLRILETWKQEIADGNPEPWIMPKGNYRGGMPVVKITESDVEFEKQLIEWQNNQKYPWKKSS